jgi:NADH-quinone oxidoreductase subunit E
MLSEKERVEIEEETLRTENRKAASIEALKIVQKHRGWVSDEAIKDLAAFLAMEPDELDGVATFYSLIFRRPVGTHVILVCDSVSCWVMGYPSVKAHLEKRLGIRLGETTPDGRFTLLPAACLGVCDEAPAMFVDDDLHTRLSEERIDRILERYGQD